MPLYLDLHKIQSKAKEGFGLTPEDDLLNDHNSCRCLSSWYDLEKNYGVSIFDAPNETVLKRILETKAGNGSHEIFPVHNQVVEVFLKRMEGNGNSPGNKKHLLRTLNNTEVVRVLIILATSDPVLLRYEIGEKSYNSYNKNFEETIEELLFKFQGEKIHQQENYCIASFLSVFNALSCALKIKNRLFPLIRSAKPRLMLMCENASEKPAPLPELQFHKKSNSEIVISSQVESLCGATAKKLKESEPNLYWLKSSEEKLLRLLLQVLNQNWQRPNFNCREFRRKISMSKAGLYRKCSALTGRSPNSLIREYRLLQALRLLKSGQGITKTCYDTGFNSPSYFSHCFRQQFKIPPGFYRGLCDA